MPDNKNVHIVMDKDLRNKLKEWCAKNGKSMKEVMDELVLKLICEEVDK